MADELQRADYEEPRCLLCETDPESDRAKVLAIPTGRVIERLDALLGKNDYDGAERHLRHWLHEAEEGGDRRGAFTLCNELMGLCRKTGQKDEALRFAERTLALIGELGMQNHISAATAKINAATVFKAFGRAEDGLPLFEQARDVMVAALEPNDARLAGLFNNMALALADLGRLGEARACFERALNISLNRENGQTDAAVTLLNLANLEEAEHGLLNGNEKIMEDLDRALALLNEAGIPQNGDYAFVCEKCAPTFGYYGCFAAEQDLLARARRIYEGA